MSDLEERMAQLARRHTLQWHTAQGHVKTLICMLCNKAPITELLRCRPLPHNVRHATALGVLDQAGTQLDQAGTKCKGMLRSMLFNLLGEESFVRVHWPGGTHCSGTRRKGT